jgi:TolB-like protein
MKLIVLVLLGIAFAVPSCQSGSGYNSYHDLRSAEAAFQEEEEGRLAEIAEAQVARLAYLEDERKAKSIDESEELIEICYNAIDELLDQHPDSDSIDRLLVAAVADINNVNGNTMFGRVIGEKISARFTQSSIDVIHPTEQDGQMLVESAGQFIRSEDVQNIEKGYNTKTALVSTYAVAGNTVHVSVKLVSTVDNVILAATDFVIYQSELVKDMLAH